jgi:hypothetical protein
MGAFSVKFQPFFDIFDIELPFLDRFGYIFAIFFDVFDIKLLFLGHFFFFFFAMKSGFLGKK